MKILIVASTAVLFALTPAAWAQDVSPADFAGKASVGNAFEVQEAKLAVKQSKDGKVKSFARMMVKDHTAAEKKLEAAAKASGAPVGTALDADHQAKLDALNGKTGADFDKAYMADQIQAHTEAADLLAGYSQSGGAPKLKAWAKATLPTVKMHLQHAQSIAPAASM
ncbi:DUF4142 domain-containing protein [Labrys wisconsinensis]|uniref:Membrane protein n=1 Tax=Labrys wisconsinensis TaxID=425677 RepID=A0ABU0JF97_9HYPH|nr:DUF4142 domain-containing protein [Labrys wisconsinensis]MDQ0472959.1 putative membrane protein [Labrys wisconsinensis]